jgi:hypothetical protein
MGRKTHGMTATKEFYAWSDIKKRCLNENCKAYVNYGGRGITVCDEWINSFETFFNDMGYAPSKSHSIDRINNNDGYYKENCRWTDIKTQANNKRPMKKPIDNTSGYKGIDFSKKNNKWRARIYKGKEIHLGLFDNIEDAIKARELAEKEFVKVKQYYL